MSRILYFTDRTGVSPGYRPIFARILQANNIKSHQVQTYSVYNQIPKAIRKRGQELEQVVNQEELPRVQRLVDFMIRTVKPSLLVVSCPAVLAVVNQNIPGADKIGNCRGSVYT